jgi:O-antigen/teichoic acid export membrane protein
VKDTRFFRLRTHLAAPRVWLPPRATLHSISLLVAGNVFKLGLGVATSAIVFRALEPGGAGRLALTLSLVGLFSLLGEFGLRDAAVTFIARALPTNPTRAHSVARTFLLAKLALSTFAGAVAYCAAGWLAATFYPDANVAGLLQLGAFSLVTGGLLGFALTILEARQAFAAISVSSILQAVVRALLILVLYTFREINLVTLVLLEALVPLVIFFYSLRFIPKSSYRLRAPLLEHLPALFHFTKWIAVAAIASTIFLKLDVLLLGYFRPPAEVGLYAVALALVGRLDVLKNAVLTTAFPDATRRTGVAELRAFIRQSLRVTGLASLAVAPLFFLSSALIVWIYGTAYAPAQNAFIPLLLAFLCGLNAEPLSYVLYALNRPHWIARMDLCLLAFHFGLNVMLIPSGGIAGAAFGVLLTRLVGAILTLLMVKRAVAKIT